MIDLISQYGLSDLIVFGLALAAAIKGTWDLVDYFINKYKAKFNKDVSELKKEEEIVRRQEQLEAHYKNCEGQHQETIQLYNSLETKIDKLAETVDTKFEELDKRIDLLTSSDKFDIKSFIVEKYHYFVEQQGWIDDFSLDVLERRFGVYEAEGGNTYIAGLMSELRQLPKHAPR